MKRKGRRSPALAVFAAGITAFGLASAAPQGTTSRPEGASPATCEQHVDGAPAMVVCDAGGDGAQSCETHTTVSVSGIGYVSGCGVSCDAGAYACCHEATMFQKATCGCQAYPPRGPYTPDVP